MAQKEISLCKKNVKDDEYFLVKENAPAKKHYSHDKKQKK
jgi:hypothetical protein